MGTSGSFGGSGGPDARNLRDTIADWLTDDSNEQHLFDDSQPTTPGERVPVPPRSFDLTPALRLLLRSRSNAADGPGGGGGSGGSAGGGAGRSSGGASRSVGRLSRAAGRASGLALAYNSGDRDALEQAGLDYDQLRLLNDPLAVGFAIVDAAFDTQPDSTIDDSEAREIVAAVVEWILDAPVGSQPSVEDVVRKAIETIVADVTLTEIASTISKKGSSFESRRSAEQMVRGLAEEHAAQVKLTATGATGSELADAIESGIGDLARIMGVDS